MANWYVGPSDVPGYGRLIVVKRDGLTMASAIPDSSVKGGYRDIDMPIEYLKSNKIRLKILKLFQLYRGRSR